MKMLFSSNFSHFLSYFLSIQINFITENFKITAKSQSTEQITTKSQHHTPPRLQWRPTAANSDNHNHQNTTTTPPHQQQKSKSQREIGGSKARSHGGEIEGKIKRRGAWCDRRDLVRPIVGLELGVRRRRRRHDLGFLSFLSRALSLSLSLCVSDPEIVWSENLSFKPFPWSKPHFSKSTSNNFRKIYFSCATKHPHFWKSISGSDLKSKQTQPKKYQLVELQDFWQKRKIYYFRFSIIFKYLVVLNLIFLRRDNTSCVLPIYVIQTLTFKFHK